MELQQTGLSLLDDLACSLGCLCVSDLHNPMLLPQIRHILKNVNSSIYPLSGWTDAVFYLTGCSNTFTSLEDAKQFLLDWAPA